jgi:hypothetical protein
MNTNYEFETTDSPYSQFYVEFIVYGILLAAVLKILRADRLAGKTFNAAIMLPIFFTLFLALPFALSFAALSLAGLANIFREIISGIVAIVVCYYLIAKNSPEGSSIIENIKYFINSKSPKKDYGQKTHIQELQGLDSQLENELNNKFFYQLLMIGLSIFVYFIFQDMPLFQGFYDFLNYGLYPVMKYFLLLLILGLVTYGYSKYYDFYCGLIYKQLSSLVLFLEREKKFVLIKHKEGYPQYEFSIQKVSPWEGRERTNHYYFVMSEDNQIAYWIKPNLDFTHYKNVIPQLKATGIEGLLDKVIARTKQPTVGS